MPPVIACPCRSASARRLWSSSLMMRDFGVDRRHLVGSADRAGEILGAGRRRPRSVPAAATGSRPGPELRGAPASPPAAAGCASVPGPAAAGRPPMSPGRASARDGSAPADPAAGQASPWRKLSAVLALARLSTWHLALAVGAGGDESGQMQVDQRVAGLAGRVLEIPHQRRNVGDPRRLHAGRPARQQRIQLVEQARQAVRAAGRGAMAARRQAVPGGRDAISTLHPGCRRHRGTAVPRPPPSVRLVRRCPPPAAPAARPATARCRASTAACAG